MSPSKQDKQPNLRLLNQDETAEFLRVSVKTLAAWRCKGQGPKFAKLGRRVVYPFPALVEYVEKCTA